MIKVEAVCTLYEEYEDEEDISLEDAFDNMEMTLYDMGYSTEDFVIRVWKEE